MKVSVNGNGEVKISDRHMEVVLDMLVRSFREGRIKSFRVER